MRTVHLYIARTYVLNAATLLVLLFGFVVTIDVFVNLRRFAGAAAEAAEMAGNEGAFHNTLLTIVYILDFWWPKLLQLFNYVIGVVLVAAMGFTCAQMVRHREFVALLASGVSLHRLARPFLVVALAFTGLQALNQELALPAVAHLLTRDQAESGTRHVDPFRVRLVSDGTGLSVSAQRYDDARRALLGVRAYERGDAGSVRAVITADEAVWDQTLDAGAGGWRLVGGVRTPEFDPETGRRPSPTPLDRLGTRLDPARLKVASLSGFAQNLSTGQLAAMIEQGGMPAEERERLRKAMWGRYGALASNFLTLAAALPFFLVREPRAMGRAAVRAAPVCLLGLAAAAAAPVLELPGVAPWIAAFVPATLLLAVALALFSEVKS